MNKDGFLIALQAEIESFAHAVATSEGQWIIKGFIDVYQNIYSISVDTKIVSKVLELLLFPMFVIFGEKHGFRLDLSPQQNFYPDVSFVHLLTGQKFAVDIKSTYRTSKDSVNGMTLGAFTGYFRNRSSQKNILYPYADYEGHYVLGVIYSRNDDALDERIKYTLEDLATIPSVIHSFQFFAQPKYRIAVSRPGSGNTKNIGSCTNIADLVQGNGIFSALGEDVYDDYWMFYLTADMAKTLELPRPYSSLKTYFEYKQRGMKSLNAHQAVIRAEPEDEEA